MRSSPWIELTSVDRTLVHFPQKSLAAFTILRRVLRDGDVQTLAGGERPAYAARQEEGRAKAGRGRSHALGGRESSLEWLKLSAS
jgi:hypothetical protein